ncbi:MAG: hypothetical protein U9P61_01585 [Patescibacteria group bacterium]|nr:hypothetical protein [Patescibacteria group bacterium]
MKNKFIISSLVFSFLLFIPFSLQVNADNYGDIYNEKERLSSIKENATYLLLIAEGNETLKTALEDIISITETIEDRFEEIIEEDFSSEIDFIESLENTINLDSFSSELDFSFQGEEVYDDDILGTIIHLNIENDNKVDKTNEKMETDLDLDFLFYDNYAEEQYQGSFSMMFKIVEESVFVRLNDFQLETENDEANSFYHLMIEPTIEEIKDRNILLDEFLEEVEEQLEGEVSEVDISPEEVEEIAKEVVLSAFNRGVFKMEGVESEYINGERMKKHSFSIDFQKIPCFLEDTLWYVQEFDDDISDEEIEEAIEEARREIERVDVRSELEREGFTYELIFDVWTDGDYVRKMEVYLDGNQVDTYSDISMIFDLSIFIDDLNESIEIEAPDDYIGIYELLEEYGLSEGLEF